MDCVSTKGIVSGWDALWNSWSQPEDSDLFFSGATRIMNFSGCPQVIPLCTKFSCTKDFRITCINKMSERASLGTHQWTPTHTHSHQVLCTWVGCNCCLMLTSQALTLTANKNSVSLKEKSRVSGDQFNQNLKGFPTWF